MASLYDELVSNLKEQFEYYGELTAIGKEKTSIIINNDIESLAKINQVENMLVVRLEKLDKKNSEILNDIIMVTGKQIDNVTVKNVASLLSNEEGAELERLTQQLFEVATEMKEVNEKNKILVDTSLEFADFSLNVYRQVYDTDVKVTYDKNGKIDND